MKEQTKATHIWELGSSVLNVCTTNLCVEFTQLSSNRELTPCRLPFWNISYSSDCCFYFRSGFLSEDLRVPLVMLPLKKKKIKLTKHFRGWIATAPHFSFCSSNISHHILAVLTSPWICLCFTHPVLYPNAAVKHANPCPYRNCQFCLCNNRNHAVGGQPH